jgi:hypothetical protein
MLIRFRQIEVCCYYCVLMSGTRLIIWDTYTGPESPERVKVELLIQGVSSLGPY